MRFACDKVLFVQGLRRCPACGETATGGGAQAAARDERLAERIAGACGAALQDLVGGRPERCNNSELPISREEAASPSADGTLEGVAREAPWWPTAEPDPALADDLHCCFRAILRVADQFCGQRERMHRG